MMQAHGLHEQAKSGTGAHREKNDERSGQDGARWSGGSHKVSHVEAVRNTRALKQAQARRYPGNRDRPTWGGTGAGDASPGRTARTARHAAIIGHNVN